MNIIALIFFLCVMLIGYGDCSGKFREWEKQGYTNAQSRMHTLAWVLIVLGWTSLAIHFLILSIITN